MFTHVHTDLFTPTYMHACKHIYILESTHAYVHTYRMFALLLLLLRTCIHTETDTLESQSTLEYIHIHAFPRIQQVLWLVYDNTSATTHLSLASMPRLLP